MTVNNEAVATIFFNSFNGARQKGCQMGVDVGAAPVSHIGFLYSLSVLWFGTIKGLGFWARQGRQPPRDLAGAARPGLPQPTNRSCTIRRCRQGPGVAFATPAGVVRRLGVSKGDLAMESVTDSDRSDI
ncbi:hypothetical protein ACIQNG_38520 [Streptomyces sp. NPDC091377]|uniref:hypothetical protein n=1 Tax=Streptomyces sp. NPDC091377 TaxID=3365995 RepID=UPI003805F656